MSHVTNDFQEDVAYNKGIYLNTRFPSLSRQFQKGSFWVGFILNGY